MTLVFYIWPRSFGGPSRVDERQSLVIPAHKLTEVRDYLETLGLQTYCYTFARLTDSLSLE